MDNWNVVLVIIALVGLVTAIVAPIIKLTTTVTKLIGLVDTCEKDLASIDRRNTESHALIYKRLEAAEETGQNHETRLVIIEHDMKGENRQ